MVLLLAFDSHDVPSRRVYIVNWAGVSLNDVECMTVKTVVGCQELFKT